MQEAFGFFFGIFPNDWDMSVPVKAYKSILM